MMAAEGRIFVVTGGLLDELDRRSATTDSNRDLSTASTVDVSNVHPYLMRHADAYAHDNSGASTSGPTFINVKPLSQFEAGQKVLYTGSNRSASEAIIMKVLHDDDNKTFYTIKLACGKEEQAESDKLNQNVAAAKGATDENGNVPMRCVDFKINPTPLFQSLYQSKWKEAQRCLQSNPEEVSIWVARYAKKPSNKIRWQLLPLHLFIALAGSNNAEAEENDDVPLDEKDEMQRMEEEMKEGKSAPLEILNALLSVYPQATQCTDDQDMIPLHSAIRGNSSLKVIEKLLEADPFSVYRKDARGRNAFILVERVYGKRIHKVQVGGEDKARERKYAKLMGMLSDSAMRVSSPPRSMQPKEKAAPDLPQQEKQGHETSNLLQELQAENLALRRENVMLHHRADMNGRLLEQLVEKLQMYEEQRSVDMEFSSERRQEILLSISEDDDKKFAEENKQDTEQKQVKEKEAEERPVGGEGAYHKRLERYLSSTPSKIKGNISVISPASSSITETTEPISPPPASVLMPKFDSCDEDDANGTGAESGDEGKVEVTKRDGTESNVASESDESSNTNAEGQNIFRARDAETQDNIPTKAEVPIKTVQLDDVVYEVGATKDDPPNTSQPQNTKEKTSRENTVESEAIDAMQSNKNTSKKKQNDSASAGAGRPAILPVLSSEEEDQLCVE